MQKKTNIHFTIPSNIWGVPIALFEKNGVYWLILMLVFVFLFRSNPLFCFLGFVLSHLIFCCSPFFTVKALVAKYERLRKSRYIETDIPFDKLEKDESTVILKDGGLCRIYVLKDIANVPEEQQIFLWEKWFKSIAESSKIFSLPFEKHQASVKILTWRQKEQNNFENECFLILSVKKSPTMYDDMQKMCQKTENILGLFQPLLLSADTNISPLLIFAEITSPITPLYMIGSESKSISEQLSSNEIHMENKGVICFQQGKKCRYLSSVTVKKSAEMIDTKLIEDIQSIDAECMFLHDIHVYNSKMSDIYVKQRKIFDFKNCIGRLNRYQQTNKLLEQGEVLVQMGISVFIWSNSKQELANTENKIKSIYSSYNYEVVKNTNTDVATYMSLFPVSTTYPLKLNYLSSEAALLCYTK